MSMGWSEPELLPFCCWSHPISGTRCRWWLDRQQLCCPPLQLSLPPPWLTDLDRLTTWPLLQLPLPWLASSCLLIETHSLWSVDAGTWQWQGPCCVPWFVSSVPSVILAVDESGMAAEESGKVKHIQPLVYTPVYKVCTKTRSLCYLTIGMPFTISMQSP